jgi:hypothetical protein
MRHPASNVHQTLVLVGPAISEQLQAAGTLGSIGGTSRTIGHMLSGPAHELPRIGFLDSKDVRDVAVRVVERFSKDVRGSLCGR